MKRLTTEIDPKSEGFQARADDYAHLLDQLGDNLDWALDGGGEKMVRRHRERGKILVRDRIDLLIDPGTGFLELSPLAAIGLYENQLPAAGIVTGIGSVRGTSCMIIANDATVKGGSFYRETVKKHIRAQEIAMENRLPVLYLVDCGGANLNQMEEVFYDENHFGGTFHRQCRMSAKGIPQLAIVFGECTAGGAYIPALCDEFIMVQDAASIHLGGPQIVQAAISETVNRMDLGGAAMHTLTSGVSDNMAPDELSGLGRLRDMVEALGYQQPYAVPRGAVEPPLLNIEEIPGIVGTDLSRPFDQREVIARIVDGSAFHEFKPAWGETLVCGFAQLEGFPVGIIANNGVLFSEACLKGAHFIELCDQRNMPLIFLQNTTGFMVGSEAERGGISKHSAKLVYAMSNAHVPRYTVITGSSYGAGNYGMSGRGFRPRFLFMWPNARLGGMNPDVGSAVLMDLRRASISRGADSEVELAEHEAKLRAMFEEKSDPYFCTARLFDDGIIDPRDTRRILGLCVALGNTLPDTGGHRPVYRM
ncbi:methylcrotonoyl-CoA carboxylase [Roseovarius sp. TE539]|uniref:carboxyl transferase domain-containing protein n=1 Tax=Roseovarius sp. TE539 TaxID=2249812 RepID=UPI000DDF0BBF|nr:carboxyl transferase domain-containing protein [Roseovarius sp. TE539]RBI69864.1 methylcrotonoyl-CoA carboxylase [Roseovarius sp. TE539]